MSKKVTQRLFAVFVVLVIFNLGVLKTAFAEEIDVSAESAILADADSGKILFQKNPDEMLPPASMTKMMTEYIVLDSIKKGKLSWDQKISISDYAHKVSQKRSLSNVPLRIDDQYSARELFEATAIYSANAADIALAEAIAGTEPNFVKLMNDKAKELGLKKYKFVNCTGLNNSDLAGMSPTVDPADTAENEISARDLALLAYRLIKDYPEILQTSSIPHKIFRQGTTDAIKMDNWNWMLPSLVYAYEGVDGLKTGSTPTAGYSFTGTAKRGNVRLISVIMKADSYKSRFNETKKLFDFGSNNFVKQQVVNPGQVVKGAQAPVVKGKAKAVSIAAKGAINVLVRRGETNTYEPGFEVNKSLLNEEGGLVAPVAKGKVIGYVTLKYKGTGNYGYLMDKGPKVEAVAAKTVEKANWLVLLFRWIFSFFK